MGIIWIMIIKLLRLNRDNNASVKMMFLLFKDGIRTKEMMRHRCQNMDEF